MLIIIYAKSYHHITKFYFISITELKNNWVLWVENRHSSTYSAIKVNRKIQA